MLKEPLRLPINPDEFEKIDIKRDFISPLEFANRLGYTRSTITSWCREGKLKFIRFGKNIFIYKFEFIRMSDEEKFKIITKGKHKKKRSLK
jgi:excisionase family DNA binding protein